MLYILIGAAALICALQAITASRLLISAIWLAAASAMVSVLLYMLGAAEVAVIELSVGAGLVTVLFVFAINITGDEEINAKSVIPSPIAWGMTLLPLILLGLISLPLFDIPLLSPESSEFKAILWQDRSPDLFLQIVLIFAGVLGILGLLAEQKNHTSKERSS